MQPQNVTFVRPHTPASTGARTSANSPTRNGNALFKDGPVVAGAGVKRGAIGVAGAAAGVKRGAIGVAATCLHVCIMYVLFW